MIVYAVSGQRRWVHPEHRGGLRPCTPRPDLRPDRRQGHPGRRDGDVPARVRHATRGVSPGARRTVTGPALRHVRRGRRDGARRRRIYRPELRLAADLPHRHTGCGAGHHTGLRLHQGVSEPPRKEDRFPGGHQPRHRAHAPDARDHGGSLLGLDRLHRSQIQWHPVGRPGVPHPLRRGLRVLPLLGA